MSFLSGLFLFALPLAAAPVVLHLYRRRQRVVVPWGAMQFLTNASKQGRRRERWEEILLMLMRAAMLLALVFALSRPQLSGEWFGDHATREVILVLDDSMSMSRDVGEETPFSNLTQKASDVLDELSHEDVVQVMTAVGGPQWLTTDALHMDDASKDRLLSKIKTLKPTTGAADFFSCLQAALSIEPDRDAQARHVIVITDGQSHGWRTEADAGWRRLHDVVDASRFPTTLQTIICGIPDSPIENVAVTSIEASQTHVGIREEVTLRVEVQNLGEFPSSPMTLEMFANDQSLRELDVDALNSNETTTLEWKWQSDEPGVYALSCRLSSEDQIATDNTDAAIVKVVGEIPILIVEAEKGYRQRMRDSSFIAAALGYQREKPREGWHSVFAPHFVSTGDFETTTLSDYRTIVITDLEPFLSESAERLREFVERGGGLWIALGRRTDQKSFNAVWYDEGVGLSPLALDDVDTTAGDDEQEAVIHPPSSDHATTAHLADTNRLDIDSVRIKARHTFEPPAPGQELSILLETGDGEPLVIENFLGRGRVIFQALPFDVTWSNLPLTKAYVVMVHDWLDYLSQPAATQHNLSAGGRIELSQSVSQGGGNATIVLPDGSKKPLAVRAGGDSLFYRYSQTQWPGRYEVRWGDKVSDAAPFQVARDAAESNLEPLTEQQRESLTATAGIQFPDEFTEIIPEVPGLQKDKPIWNSFLAAVVMLLLGELFLATRAARRRTPSVSAPASWGELDAISSRRTFEPKTEHTQNMH